MAATRRAFIKNFAIAGSALAVPSAWQRVLADSKKLPRRSVAASGLELPVVGLGNSNVFREGDVQASMGLMELLHQHGGSYIDCIGPSRFVVAEAAGNLGIGNKLFLGSYFSDDDEATNRADAQRLLEMTGKSQLDVMQSYPEFVIPNWDHFRRWKDEGLTRFIGMARHRSEYYESMMGLMETGTVDIIQVNYSPLETEADQAILPMALDKGVAVTINRPFINGEYFSLVRGHEVPEWASEFDCDNWAAFSIKFILSHPAVTCVLTETANPKHATQNMEAGFGRLPDQKTRQRMVSYLQNL